MPSMALVGASLFAGLLCGLSAHPTIAGEVSNVATEEELRRLAIALGVIMKNHVDPVDDKKLIKWGIKGMVASLDRHSAYLDTEALEELKTGTPPGLGGIGLELRLEDGMPYVVAPLDGAPSSTAGIRSGDRISKLDDTPTKGMPLSEVIKRLRGTPGSQVTLTIIRKGVAQPLTIPVKRETIRVQSIQFKTMEPGYGYIRIKQFKAGTAENVAKLLGKFYRDTSVKGLILDLRDNPGGLLESAIGTAAVFLPPQTLIVSVSGRAPESKKEHHAGPENYIFGSKDEYLRDLPRAVKTTPLVVLVNGVSAAGSEIVAGALQDHKRATIVGMPTFGHDSLQTVLPLRGNTALKLTTDHWLTPKGRSISATGITPDVTVEDSLDTPTLDEALDRAMTYLIGRNAL